MDVRLHSPNRLNTLADGIFAIAMTLFALDVRVPDSLADTRAAFDREFPHLLSHFGIFAAVLLAFTSLMHLRLLRHVTEPDLELSDIDPEVRCVALERSAWASATFLLAIPLALVLPHPAYAMLVWLIVPFARRGIRAARRGPPLAG
jgi:hypothetical protein